MSNRCFFTHENKINIICFFKGCIKKACNSATSNLVFSYSNTEALFNNTYNDEEKKRLFGTTKYKKIKKFWEDLPNKKAENVANLNENKAKEWLNQKETQKKQKKHYLYSKKQSKDKLYLNGDSSNLRDEGMINLNDDHDGNGFHYTYYQTLLGYKHDIQCDEEINVLNFEKILDQFRASTNKLNINSVSSSKEIFNNIPTLLYDDFKIYINNDLSNFNEKGLDLLSKNQWKWVHQISSWSQDIIKLFEMKNINIFCLEYKDVIDKIKNDDQMNTPYFIDWIKTYHQIKQKTDLLLQEKSELTLYAERVCMDILNAGSLNNDHKIRKILFVISIFRKDARCKVSNAILNKLKKHIKSLSKTATGSEMILFWAHFDHGTLQRLFNILLLENGGDDGYDDDEDDDMDIYTYMDEEIDYDIMKNKNSLKVIEEIIDLLYTYEPFEIFNAENCKKIIQNQFGFNFLVSYYLQNPSYIQETILREIAYHHLIGFVFISILNDKLDDDDNDNIESQRILNNIMFQCLTNHICPNVAMFRREDIKSHKTKNKAILNLIPKSSLEERMIENDDLDLKAIELHSNGNNQIRFDIIFTLLIQSILRNKPLIFKQCTNELFMHLDEETILTMKWMIDDEYGMRLNLIQIIASNGDTEFIHHLLDYIDNKTIIKYIMRTDEYQRTSLQIAAARNNVKMVEYLMNLIGKDSKSSLQQILLKKDTNNKTIFNYSFHNIHLKEIISKSIHNYC